MQSLEIKVFRRPNMFRVNYNFYHMLGVGELENLFTIENYECKQQALQLFYPERFLNIVEQKALIERIKKAKNYTEVQITTSSPFILQCCSAKYIKIYKPEDEQLSENVFKLSTEESGMPNDGGLGIL